MNSPPSHAVLYRPELDALRFFAFLCVFQHHTGLPTSIHLPQILVLIHAAGEFGVCLFFLLSAYLITDLLWHERSRTGDIHLGSFYLRRILRIWPLYFLFLALGVGAGFIWPNLAVEPMRIVASLLLLGNWFTASFGSASNPIAPLWSISVEEQFYVLMPPLARAGGKRALLVASAIVLILAYLVLWWLGIRHASANVGVWTNSLVQFQFFAVGCILATVLNGKAPNLPLLARLGIVFIGLCLWILAARGGLADTLPLQPTVLCAGYTIALAGTTLLFLATLGTQLAIPGWLRYLGKISYGLYVYHLAVMDFFGATKIYWDGTAAKLVRGVVELLVTIAIASISYQFLERPFLRLKERFTFVPSRVS